MDAAEQFPDLARPDGSLLAMRAQRQASLAGADTWSLANELLVRLQNPGERLDDDARAWVLSQLDWTLRERLNLHNNRFAPRRYLDLYGTLYAHVKPRLPLAGATFVDLGCGGVNPLGLLMVFLALGAKRGIGVDLDHLQNVSVAARALADVAALMAVNPQQIAWDQPITGVQVLQNLASFDLRRLAAGDAGGLDTSRLTFLRESIYGVPIDAGIADVVMSNAFLEHIPDVPRALAEIARITRPGGYSVHNIDMTDHRRYQGKHGPLDFLYEASNAATLHGCNRMRLSDFVAAFDRAGFTVLGVQPGLEIDVTAAQRSTMRSPFHSAPLDDLRIGMAVVVAQKR